MRARTTRCTDVEATNPAPTPNTTSEPHVHAQGSAASGGALVGAAQATSRPTPSRRHGARRCVRRREARRFRFHMVRPLPVVREGPLALRLAHLPRRLTPAGSLLPAQRFRALLLLSHPALAQASRRGRTVRATNARRSRTRGPRAVGAQRPATR